LNLNLFDVLELLWLEVRKKSSDGKFAMKKKKWDK